MLVLLVSLQLSIALRRQELGLRNYRRSQYKLCKSADHLRSQSARARRLSRLTASTLGLLRVLLVASAGQPASSADSIPSHLLAHSINETPHFLKNTNTTGLSPPIAVVTHSPNGFAVRPLIGVPNYRAHSLQ